jgi:hypothetical protein
MAARLEDQDFPQVIEIVAHPGAFFEDRASRDGRIAAGDDPQRLASGMHVDDGQFVHAACIKRRRELSSESGAAALAGACAASSSRENDPQLGG